LRLFFLEELNMEKENITSARQIKRSNRQKIYRYLRDHEQASRQEIAIGLNLSYPTVTSNLNYLTEIGYIRESSVIQNTGGRNAISYSFVKDVRKAIGVYLSGNHMDAVAVDLSGEVIMRVRHRVYFNLDSDEYLRTLGSMVDEIVRESGANASNLLGINIALPGLISDDGEKVSYGYSLGFTGKTKKEICRYIKYPCSLVHDTFTFGYAEILRWPEIDSAFYISLCSSVGGTLLMNNRVVEGSTHKCGEIGHMKVVTGDGAEKCYCGQLGCFDTVCRSGKLDSCTGGDLELFFQRLRDHDPEAEKRWDVYLDYLAGAVSNVRILLDTRIIIGGYVGAYIDEYMDDLTSRINRISTFDDPAENYVYACRVKVEAAATGAAQMLISRFIHSV
jgi:predicted NBD/HSP70 family sugar kinase